MSGKVGELLKELRNYKQKHVELFKAVFYADSNWFGMDLLVSATLNRSLCLIRGFCDLLEGKNFVAGVPLLRLQIDNCIRLSAAWLVDDPHRFALDVFSGIPVKDQRDKSGNRMSDSYLVGKIAEQHPWVSKVYKNASGYVHLSDKHFFNAMQVDSEKNGTVVTKISDYDQFVPEESYISPFGHFEAKVANYLESRYPIRHSS
jgi:hypothetical protein